MRCRHICCTLAPGASHGWLYSAARGPARAGTLPIPSAPHNKASTGAISAVAAVPARAGWAAPARQLMSAAASCALCIIPCTSSRRAAAASCWAMGQQQSVLHSLGPAPGGLPRVPDLMLSSLPLPRSAQHHPLCCLSACSKLQPLLDELLLHSVQGRDLGARRQAGQG
jgi:hypothetical protein